MITVHEWRAGTNFTSLWFVDGAGVQWESTGLQTSEMARTIYKPTLTGAIPAGLIESVEVIIDMNVTQTDRPILLEAEISGIGAPTITSIVTDPLLTLGQQQRIIKMRGFDRTTLASITDITLRSTGLSGAGSSFWFYDRVLVRITMLDKRRNPAALLLAGREGAPLITADVYFQVTDNGGEPFQVTDNGGEPFQVTGG